MIKRITDKNRKQLIAREILEGLPEWFGIEEAREAYISNSADQELFAAFKNHRPVGFLTLKETGKDTVEIAVMGVLKSFHRQGIGRNLFEAAKEYSMRVRYSFMQVKTVQTGCYEIYDHTNKFYQSLGFKEFEIFPTLWDPSNPCQIYVMSLSCNDLA
ncbi:GNAT family N-acetyltransferase [Fervidibacillus albus]|uniref:GNAT family N-acetyltransferase n=1 Tax=Fervidibacillus albus TaxID=2980026 RepID=A0A9E8LSU0_9BACI|nr:GNAT family N-acetyltransferase [Fervidibacillus albus]WAA08959.1 GNAT family N-acetyltransferase [Fervidibacillus albus]